jgi:hypothetical protein
MDTKIIHPMMLVSNASPRRLGAVAFLRLNNFALLKQLRVAAFLTLLMQNNFQSLQRLGVVALKLNFEMNPGNSGTIGSVGNVDLKICHQNYITQRKLDGRQVTKS